MVTEPNPVEPPRGIYTSRVDDKGRLKLPKDFEAYLRRFPEERFFITTLDGRVVRIYPISVWRENEAFFERHEEEAESAEDVSFFANLWGAESPLDGQGRVLIPPDLRRELNVENQPVWVGAYKGAVEIYNESVLKQRREQAMGNLQQKVASLRKKGFK